MKLDVKTVLEFFEKKQKLIFILFSVSLVIYWIYIPSSQNWKCSLELSDNSLVELNFWSKKKMKHGHPHIFEWGGGYERWGFKAKIDNEWISWEGEEQPRIFDSIGGQYYLITDRIRVQKIGLFVLIDKKWQEISFDQVPKQIAIPNHFSRPFRHSLYNPNPFVCENEREKTAEFEYRPSHFTQQLWYFLETGENEFHVHPTKLEELKLKYLE